MKRRNTRRSTSRSSRRSIRRSSRRVSGRNTRRTTRRNTRRKTRRSSKRSRRRNTKRRAGMRQFGGVTPQQRLDAFWAAQRSAARRTESPAKAELETEPAAEPRDDTTDQEHSADSSGKENVIILFTDHPEEADDSCAILNLCSWVKDSPNNHLIIFYGGKKPEKWVAKAKQDAGVPQLLDAVPMYKDPEISDRISYFNINKDEIEEGEIGSKISSYRDKALHILICGPACPGLGDEVLSLIPEDNVKSLFIQGEAFNVNHPTLERNFPEWPKAVEDFKGKVRGNGGVVFDGENLPGGYDEITGLKWPTLEGGENDSLSRDLYNLLNNNPSAIRSILGFHTRCSTTSPPFAYTPASWCQVSVARPLTPGQKITSDILNKDGIKDPKKWGETTNHTTSGYFAGVLGCPSIDLSELNGLEEFPRLKDAGKGNWTNLYKNDMNSSLSDIDAEEAKRIKGTIKELGEFLISNSFEFKEALSEKPPPPETVVMNWLYFRAGILWWWRSWIAASAIVEGEGASVDQIMKKAHGILQFLLNNCNVALDHPGASETTAKTPGFFLQPLFGTANLAALPSPQCYYDDTVAHRPEQRDTSFKREEDIRTAFIKSLMFDENIRNALINSLMFNEKEHELKYGTKASWIRDTFNGFSKIPDFLKNNYDNGKFKLNSLLPHLGDLSASFIVIDFLNGVTELKGKISAENYGPAADGLMKRFRDNLNKLGYVSGDTPESRNPRAANTSETVETPLVTQDDSNLIPPNPE